MDHHVDAEVSKTDSRESETVSQRPGCSHQWLKGPDDEV